MRTGLIDPNGLCVTEVETDQGVAVANLDLSDPQYEIALERARPWRASALDDFNNRQPILDPRSTNRSSY